MSYYNSPKQYERATGKRFTTNCPCIHRTGSVRGMVKLGYWDKDGDKVRCGNWIYLQPQKRRKSMLTYYDGEFSVDKKYAKQLVEAFNTMTSLRETCEEEVLNSNTDGKAAIYFEYEEGGDNTDALVNMANKFISEGIDVEMNVHYTNENGVGLLLIEDGQAVDLCGSECSIRDFSDEELLRELKRRGIDLIDKKNVIDILKTAQIVTAKTNGLISGFVGQIWVINDLLRKIIEKFGGEAYRVEQDGSIEYDDSENEKIKEFKEKKQMNLFKSFPSKKIQNSRITWMLQNCRKFFRKLPGYKEKYHL